MEVSGIRVKEIMTGEVVIVRPEMSITEVARLMNSFRIGGLPVVEHGKLIGMLTERDIMNRVVAANLKPSDMTVSQVMTSPRTNCAVFIPTRFAATRLPGAAVSIFDL